MFFALSEGKMPENCERARKSARNYADDFFFIYAFLIFHFPSMPCRERTCVKEQKHTLPIVLRLCRLKEIGKMDECYYRVILSETINELAALKPVSAIDPNWGEVGGSVAGGDSGGVDPGFNQLCLFSDF